MIVDFWAVEDGKLVLYKRSGECNRCGECCKAGIFYQMEVHFGSRSHERVESEEKATPADENVWEKHEGWAIFLVQGIWWYMKIDKPAEPPGHACSDLVEWLGGPVADHLSPTRLSPGAACKSWQDETFRPICRYWPMLPEHLEWFPSCGFRFERYKEVV